MSHPKHTNKLSMTLPYRQICHRSVLPKPCFSAMYRWQPAAPPEQVMTIKNSILTQSTIRVYPTIEQKTRAVWLVADHSTLFGSFHRANLLLYNSLTQNPRCFSMDQIQRHIPIQKLRAQTLTLRTFVHRIADGLQTSSSRFNTCLLMFISSKTASMTMSTSFRAL